MAARPSRAAFIRRETAEDVHDEVSRVQSVQLFDDALHAEPLRSGREAGLRCRLRVKR